MAGDPSFYYAIFKKFQSASGGNAGAGLRACQRRRLGRTRGGFSLRQTQDSSGSTAISRRTRGDYTVDDSDNAHQARPQMMPLNPNSTDPMLNPLFVMLKTSLTPGGVPLVRELFLRQGEWPDMAGHAAAQLSRRQGLERQLGRVQHQRANADRLFETWIKTGKIDDAPKSAPLVFASLVQALAAKALPGPQREQQLAAAVRRQHAGRRRAAERRPCDAGRADRPRAAALLGHLADLPDRQVWATRQIPPSLKPGEEYYVAAMIGNAGNWGAGRKFPAVPPHMWVHGDAMAFNTFLSPNVRLPALGNLDPAARNPPTSSISWPSSTATSSASASTSTTCSSG